MGLYENIKNAADNQHKSVNQIEKELGFPRSSIAKYNSHLPSTDKIYKIAKYLNVSIEYLITGHNAEYNVTDIEYMIIVAYREAPEYKKQAILDLLNVEIEVKKDALDA